MRILLTIAAVMTAFVVYASRTARGPEPPFRDLAFSDALAAAKAEGKVVMVDFFTTWCVPCKRLDKVTWKDAEVVAWLERRTVPLKIDAEVQEALATRYAVEAYPTILFLDPDGETRGRLVGYYDPKAFLSQAEKALAAESALAGAATGDPKGPLARQQAAAQAVREERYADALDLVLWCLDHGHQYDPSYDPMGAGGVAELLVPLARAYAPAADALRERRDAAAAELDSDDLDELERVERLGRVVAFDRALGESERTLELYEALRARHPDRAAPPVLFRAVLGELREAKRYAEIVESAGDVESLVLSQLTTTDALVARVPDTDDGRALVRHMRRQAVEGLAPLYEALLGVGQEAPAERAADRLIAFDPRVETIETLLQAAMRADAYAACYGLVAKGEAALPESATMRLRELRAKLPLGPPNPVDRGN